MSNFIYQLFTSSFAFAGEGTGHSHGAGAELEQLWPVFVVFSVLIVAGIIFSLASKRKK